MGIASFVAGSLFLAVFAAFLLPLSTYFYGGAIADFYNEIDERSRAITINDSEGRFIGTTDRMSYNDVFPGIESYAGEFPDHQSIYVDEVPEAYIRCVLWLEDRNAENPLRSPFGTDWWPVAKIPTDSVLTSIQNRSISLGSGGSTLPMQVARSMRKWSPKSGDRLGTLWRKLIEWRDGPIVLRERSGPSSLAWRRWISMHLPHVQATQANEFLGVEGAARTVFGKSVNDLTAAQQYVLAAAVKYNIPMTTEGDSQAKNRLNRAKACANALSGDRLDEYTVIIGELEGMEGQRLSPSPHPDLYPLIDERRHWASSPERLAANIAGPVRREIVADLRDTFGAYFRRTVLGVETSVNIVANASFSDSVRDKLRQLETSSTSGIDGSTYSFSRDQEKEQIGALVVLADGDGQIIRFYNNLSETTFYGTETRRQLVDGTFIGAYVAEQEVREVASTGKIIAALAIAELGEDSAKKGYSNACLSDEAGFRRRCYCPEGTCGDSRDVVRADQVFAASLNAPIIHRLNQLPVRDRLKELISIAGYTQPPAERSPSVEQNVVFGRLTSRPINVMLSAIAALDYIGGGSGNDLSIPSLVSDYTVVEAGTGISRTINRHDLAETYADAPATRVSFDLTGTPTGREFLRQVLMAPACNREGTLYDLRDWCPTRSDVETLVIKTGTKGTAGLPEGVPDNYDLWLVGAIKFDDGREYSFLILVGLGDPEKRFTTAGGGSLAPIADIVLSAAQSAQQTDEEN